jgi:hypothetical protein
MSPFKGKWICRKEFLDLKPINVFHREVNPDKDYTHRDDLKNLHTLFKKEFDFYVAEKGLVCGVYMAYFYLKSLAKAKRYDAVWDTLVSTGTASWYNMVKEGGTTCFEAWGVDQKFNTSLCHPWASGPVSVIIEDILGLAPKEFGWDEPTLTPHIPETESIEMTVPLVNGKKLKITATGNKGEIKL